MLKVASQKRKVYNKIYYQENREKILEHCGQYNQEHKEEYRAYHKQYSSKVKMDAFIHYGNGKLACVKCGFDDIRALSIDHIDGGGGKHRRSLGTQGWSRSFYVWLRKQGYPEGYQTLCMNCQWIKQAIFRSVYN